jgi:mannose-6-phosphate isomerase-like protein (cupin superfamily)
LYKIATLRVREDKPPYRQQTARRKLVLDVILKKFDEPDEVRKFEKGKFELVHIGGMTIGRATYDPGWKWSAHVGQSLGKKSCDVEHVGLVISGCATAAMDDGRVIEIKAGDIFYIAPGHDSWVVGDEPYVSLHLLGASDYAAHTPKASK